MPEQEVLFPSIGSIAQTTENIQDARSEESTTEEDDRAVQEIESLCMSCGEQVRRSLS